MTDFDAFMAKMNTLPAMGATPTQNTFDFWREMDALQQQAGPGGQTYPTREAPQLHHGVEQSQTPQQ